MMRVLITNDDGIHSEGIIALEDALKPIGEIFVVAPAHEMSAASRSLTLTRPLRMHRAPNGFYFVDGTPTDCVHLAVTGLLAEEPDIVIAGINHGANLGDDVIYSGTVAAAMEGRFLGLPAIAVSLVGRNARHFDTAARVVLELLERLKDHALPTDTILNVNVPDLPYAELAGFEATRLGNRHKAEPVIKSADPHGNPIYWVGSAGAEADAGPGTDFHAVRQRRVSVTPLYVDLTRHATLASVARWLAPT